MRTINYVMCILILTLIVALFTSCAPSMDTVQGKQGAPGQSIVGPAGKDGSDASPISFVKLCPASAAHYPDVFVEAAICQDNKLYAVYSSLGGFLTELTPGAYSSNAVGSACNFIVVANSCILQY